MAFEDDAVEEQVPVGVLQGALVEGTHLRIHLQGESRDEACAVAAAEEGFDDFPDAAGRDPGEEDVQQRPVGGGPLAP